ncbi:MAG: Ig-like domain-containing protein [Acidobacteriia bacterium]|nr:Ig-like domain-containing protein [Terriglobia bacterium]
MRDVVVRLTLALAAVWMAASTASARVLTFEERVKAQDGIDRVCCSDQVGSIELLYRLPSLRETLTEFDALYRFLVPVRLAGRQYGKGTRDSYLDPPGRAHSGYERVHGDYQSVAEPRAKNFAGGSPVADVGLSPISRTVPPRTPQDGPGGPILVIASSINPFTYYYAEILRTEGLDEFAVLGIADITPAVLADYDIAILGEMSFTTAQVTMLTDWTNAGGTLVAMRPDAQLSGLLGITPAAGTLSDKYLLVDTTSGPGLGIVGQTIQYHGTADLYTQSGATAVATLYSDATTATANPAVTLRAVGENGGQAIAFTYDLARSVVYTRQGNPARVGQKRDGQIPPIRSDDQFFGNASFDPRADWVDLGKVAIPQADEQQRLLANAITLGNLHRKPLPRFWYLPKGLKAAIVETGDDHGDAGMQPRFDTYIGESPANCSAPDWECVRATGYLYVGSTFTDAQALSYTNAGFEVALHVNTDCVNFTQAQYQDFITSQMATFHERFPSIPLPATNRNHCVAWSDWSMTAEVEAQNGIRFDTNYYYWPSSWIQDRPGMFTGSGFPMRFAKLDGTIIDCFQASTEMPDESGETFPAFCDALLDRATGPEGYYGVFTTNMHFDHASHAGSNAIVASAQAHGVPVVSAKQMLDWLDGRNGSSFGNITWSGGVLGFTVSAGAGARNMEAMVPTASAVGVLTGIVRDAAPLDFRRETIKGIEYAFFPATTGSYQATYAPDLTPPGVTEVSATPHPDGTAAIRWTTNEASDSRVDYGTAQVSLALNASDATLVTSHSITLGGLSPATTYYYRVTSKDAANNSVTEPLVTSDPLSFATPAQICFTDATSADFAAGTTGASTAVAETGDGEVILAPSEGAEFSGTSMPAGWFTYPLTGGGATVFGGVVVVDGARINTSRVGDLTPGGGPRYGPGRALEFDATFVAAPWQHAGFGGGNDVLPDGMFDISPWAIFSTGSGGASLLARTWNGGSFHDVDLGANWLNARHRFGIEWRTDGFVDFLIDGALVSSHSGAGYEAITTAMRPGASDYNNGGPTLTLDWIRMSPYPASGTYGSRIFDGGTVRNWGAITWTADLPAATGLWIYVRTGNTSMPDGTWTPYVLVPSSGSTIGGASRYLQYRADLSTADPDRTPALREVSISCETLPDLTPPSVAARSPSPGATDVPVGTQVVVTFSEPMNGATLTASTVRLRAQGAAIDVSATVTPSGATAALTPIAPLMSATVYTVTVEHMVEDLAGNALGADDVWTFTTAVQVSCQTDTTAPDFAAGDAGGGTYVAQTGDGEVTLEPALGEEFSGTAVPTGWSSLPWTGGTTTISNGVATVDGAYFRANAVYAPDHTLEFSATFGAQTFEQAGFAVAFNGGEPWAMFSTGPTTGQLYARTNSGASSHDVLNPGSWVGATHRFRIDWGAASVVYSIDGAVVHTETANVPTTSMRPMASDYSFGGPVIRVDWMRMSPYPAAGWFVSRVFDGGAGATWQTLTPSGDLPEGTAYAFETRTGATPTPDISWSSFAAVSGTSIPTPIGRYLQYRATLTTTSGAATPELAAVAACGVNCVPVDCDDGDPCTQDSCSAGVCAHSPIVCVASDPCHLAGVCNPETGVCSNPAKADGSACDDGNACTRRDGCQSGVCTGADPVVCRALDPCHDVGICDPATRVCSNPAKADGAACDDRNACTANDVCTGGTCGGTPGDTCPSFVCGEHEGADLQMQRERWFTSHRLDPNGRFSPDARNLALAQIDENVRKGILRTSQVRRIPGESWMPMGPAPLFSAGRKWVGRVTAIAIHPTNPNVAYIGGARGGVWKTTDHGESWTPLTDGQASLATGALAIDPRDAEIVYAGTGESNLSGDSYYGAGILKSTNGGTTWALVGQETFGGTSVSRIIVHPSDSSVLWAANTDGSGGFIPSVPPRPTGWNPWGVWKSADGGLSWNRVLGNVQTGTETTETNDLAIDPDDPDTLIAGVYNAGVWKSTDGGSTWTQKTAGLPLSSAMGRVALAIDPAESETVYAVFESITDQRQLGAYRSDDGGETWTSLPNIVQGSSSCEGNVLDDICTYAGPGAGFCNFALVIAVAPDQSVWLGGVGLWSSVDAGITWTSVCPDPVHVDQHALAFRGNDVWLGNDGGVFTTSDRGATWTSRNGGGLALTQFYPGAAAYFGSPMEILGGSQDNGSLSHEGSLSEPTWYEAMAGDGAFQAIDFLSPATRFTSTENLCVSRTTNGGASWTQADNGLEDAANRTRTAFISPLVMCPNDPRILIAGSRTAWRTADGASNWSRDRDGDLPDGQLIQAMAFAQSTGDCNTYFAGTDKGRVYRRTALFGVLREWDDITSTLPVNPAGGGINDIAVDRNAAGVVIVGLSGFGTRHVYRTTNALASPAVVTWAAIDPGIPDNPVNAVLIDPNDSSIIYIGTDVGIFRSTDGGVTWGTFMLGHPNVAVFDLVASPPAPGSPTDILSFTHGRGVYRLATNNIWGGPDVISDGGTYGLARDIQCTDCVNACVNITASDVVLDCGGRTIMGTAPPSVPNCGIGVKVAADAKNVTVRNCVIRDFPRGVHVVAGADHQDSLVEDNMIESCLDQGVLLDGDYAYNTVANNTFEDNETGVWIHSSWNTITGNTIRDSHYDGVVIDRSSYNTIVNNFVRQSGVDGMTITALSGGNAIYNNYFDEGTNVFFSMWNLGVPTVYWDTTPEDGSRIYSPGSKIGGNYWTRYSEVCADTDTDGFCDDPYYLEDHGCNCNVDRHPLSDKYRCPDGTTVGACSIQRPLFCSASGPLEDCTVCGCPGFMRCTGDGSCKVRMPPVVLPPPGDLKPRRRGGRTG